MLVIIYVYMKCYVESLVSYSARCPSYGNGVKSSIGGTILKNIF